MILFQFIVINVSLPKLSVEFLEFFKCTEMFLLFDFFTCVYGKREWDMDSNILYL